jgi:hypothetical protein
MGQTNALLWGIALVMGAGAIGVWSIYAVVRTGFNQHLKATQSLYENVQKIYENVQKIVVGLKCPKCESLSVQKAYTGCMVNERDWIATCGSCGHRWGPQLEENSGSPKSLE